MKKILESKTLWFNIITVVLMILSLIPALVDGIGLSPHTDIIIQKALVFLNAVGNGILRLYFTSQPLTQVAKNQTPPVSGG